MPVAAESSPKSLHEPRSQQAQANRIPMVQQALNFSASHVPQASNFPGAPSGQHPQYTVSQHPQYMGQSHLGAANGRSQQQHPHPALGDISKSKSCLACADISIKWYIVVIALLGLICALIGTIVGAVHSAGRDYIALTLLLVGVGLVLVAISWVALRITIKTYKSTSASRTSVLAHPRRQNPISRSLNQANHSVGTTSSLHRSLLNERLYLMATAAALSRQSAPGSARQDTGQSVGPRPDSGLDSSIKERFQRCLARFIPHHGLESHAQQDSHRRTGEQPNPSTSFSPLETQPALVPNTAALAAATALIHQYQASLMPIPSAFMHTSGHHVFGFPGSEFPLRPPPPSYNASMQDYRIRMLFQDRHHHHHHHLQHQQHQHQFSAHLGSYPPPPPPPPPPPSQLTVSSLEPEPTPTHAEDTQVLQPAQLGTDNPQSDCQKLEPQQAGPHLVRHQSGPLGTITPTTSNCLKSSASSPAIATIVNNDIYVASGAPVSQESPEQASCTTTLYNSTIVNIGSSSTTVGSAAKQGPLRRAEVKILGYL